MLLLPALAHAQSACSYIAYGAVLTAAQWNSCFTAKQDYLGFTPLNPANLIGVAPITATSSGGDLYIGLNYGGGLGLVGSALNLLPAQAGTLGGILSVTNPPSQFSTGPNIEAASGIPIGWPTGGNYAPYTSFNVQPGFNQFLTGVNTSGRPISRGITTLAPSVLGTITPGMPYGDMPCCMWFPHYIGVVGDDLNGGDPTLSLTSQLISQSKNTRNWFIYNNQGTLLFATNADAFESPYGNDTVAGYTALSFPRTSLFPLYASFGEPLIVSSVPANGWFLFDALPNNGDVAGVNGTNVTFTSGTPTGNEVAISQGTAQFTGSISLASTTFQATISRSLMILTGPCVGGPIINRAVIAGTGIVAGPHTPAPNMGLTASPVVNGLVSGTACEPGATYAISENETVATPETVTQTYGVLNVPTNPGTINVGDILTDQSADIPLLTTIMAQEDANDYYVNNSTPVSSEAMYSNAVQLTLANLDIFLQGSADTNIDKGVYNKDGADEEIIKYYKTGTLGNAFTLSTTSSNITPSGATLAGGGAQGNIFQGDMSLQTYQDGTGGVFSAPQVDATAGSTLYGATIGAAGLVATTAISYFGDTRIQNIGTDYPHINFLNLNATAGDQYGNEQLDLSGTLHIAAGAYGSSSDWLTMTQTTGVATQINALVPTIINLTGAALSAKQTGTALQIAGANGVTTRVELDGFGTGATAGAPRYTCVRGDGTGASPTAVQSGDEICSLNTFAYYGAGTSAGPAAAFRTYAAQNWGTGAYGTYSDIATTPIGSTTLTSVIRFENDGGIDCTGVTGGDKGPGSINCDAIYVNGVPVITSAPYLPLAGGTMAGPIAMAGYNITGIGALSLSGQITSTETTGTAPFVVASTTQVANLNASQLIGANWASPGAIGGTTPAAGAFTTLAANELNLPTTSSSTVGVLNINGAPFIQAYGTNNAFFGGSGNFTLTGVANTGIGNGASPGLTSGSNNVAVGKNALLSDTIGGDNMALGYGALDNNVSGNYNVAEGYSAEVSATGSEDTGIGGQIFPNLTGGSFNTAIGYDAGQGITSGNDDTIIGAAINLGGNYSSIIAIGTGDGTVRADFGFTNSGKWTLTGGLVVPALTTAGLATVTSAGLFGSEASATVPQGGTGLATLTANTIYKGNGTSALAVSSITDNGTVVATAENVTFSGLATSGTIAGALCATSGGSVLYETGGCGLGTGFTTAGTGLAAAGATINSNGVAFVSFQPGLMTAVSGNIAGFHKFSKASTVDNIEGSAQQFSCTVNPTITMYECGTSATCTSPTTIGSATLTATSTRTDGTISSASIAAGDSIAFAITAGTCVTLDASLTAQVHSN
jgi:hypothetical protein